MGRRRLFGLAHDGGRRLLVRRFFGRQIARLIVRRKYIRRLEAVDGCLEAVGRRERIDARNPTDAIAGIGGRITEVVAIVAQAMRSQSLEHAPLVIFALAATVLVLFMLRT